MGKDCKKRTDKINARTTEEKLMDNAQKKNIFFKSFNEKIENGINNIIKPKISENNPFGVKISKEFETWCLKQINSISRNNFDGKVFIHFLMTLNSLEEIRQYIVIYLGNGTRVHEFIRGFILQKQFE